MQSKKNGPQEMKSSPRKLRGKAKLREIDRLPKSGFFVSFFGNDVDAAEKRFSPVSYYSKKRVGVELPLELLITARKGGLTRGNFVSFKR